MGVRVLLLANCGEHKKGTAHDVVEVVPHGGHTDDLAQYRLLDGTLVRSGIAKVIGNG